MWQVGFGSSKIDELDKKFAGTLDEQTQRAEDQLRQLSEEQKMLGEVVMQVRPRLYVVTAVCSHGCM